MGHTNNFSLKDWNIKWHLNASVQAFFKICNEADSLQEVISSV